MATEMKILGETIAYNEDYKEIGQLKFFKDNPRVYACTYGVQNFQSMTEDEQQELIYEKLLEEPSVTNLEPEIKRHGGLMEPILVRWDTKEVIEGNSRLAVYRKFCDKEVAGEWELIHCKIIHSLEEELQDAFLSQIHVKGKTQWSAYEKANFSYVRKEGGSSVDKIAELFGESKATITTRINVIALMKQNGDNERSHFSYYDVLVRNKEAYKKIKEEGGLQRTLDDIKAFEPNKEQDEEDEDKNNFTALELRKALPVIFKKSKVLKKYEEGTIDLVEAYDRAKISKVEESVKEAIKYLEDISGEEVGKLEKNDFDAFKHVVGKLKKATKRIEKLTEDID